MIDVNKLIKKKGMKDFVENAISLLDDNGSMSMKTLKGIADNNGCWISYCEKLNNDRI